MSRLQVSFTNAGSLERQSLDAPDMMTALVIAEINMGRLPTQIRDGDRLLARLEKRGHGHAPFWCVY